jgi:acyl-coenzyme A synthetase/AMP-(fatty) acid ligase
MFANPIIAAYSRLADKYDDEANLQSCWGRASDRALEQIFICNDHKTIADIGCGTGKALLRLATRYSQPDMRFIGIEPAENMRLRARLNTADCLNIEILALVVDQNLVEVPPTKRGELHMAGSQLSLRYWEDPEHTEKAFIVPPGKDKVFYRTGDLVSRPDGCDPLIYCGRLDDQVKIHGYRVELGEVEALLRREIGVEMVVAVGWPRTKRGADGIIAFVAQMHVNVEEVLKALQARLPAYAVPHEIRSIPEFPLNANGKIDRVALTQILENKA